MLSRFRVTVASLPVLFVLFPFGAKAQQAPIALPNTMSTFGGGTTSAFTVDASCGTGSSLTATDTLGDRWHGNLFTYDLASANPANPTYGQPDLLSATVTGAGQPGGTVVFSSGTKTLCSATLNASGMASCSFISSTDGNLAVTARYQGDGNHLASSANGTLFVYDAAVRLQLSSTQLVYPGATNVTVCITPATSATATGTVQIFDGTTLLTTPNVQGGGCAYWYISPGLNAGTHQLTTVYSGDKNNPSGTSVPVIVTVSPVPVRLSASCWYTSAGTSITFQAAVSS